MSIRPVVSAPRRGIARAWPWLDRVLDPFIAVAAVALAVTGHVASDISAVDPRLHEFDLLSLVATIVAAGSLGWRRTRPGTSYVVFMVGCLVVSGSFHYIGLLAVLLPFSLFSLSTYGTRRQGLVGLVASVLCFVGLGLAGVPDLRAIDLLLSIALLVAAWALAEALRSRRDHQRDRMRAAVTDERLRIARELHDVVAHSMSLIAVQAGVGAHVLRTDPAAAQQALEVIAEYSRRALEQTRSMLGVLREESEVGTRAPTQGLDDLPALVDDVRVAGLDVTLVRSGDVPDLDAVVSLAAYRIVQESLTNVIKHSAADTATVTLTTSQGTVEVAVTDPGPARGAQRADPSGHGLIGLGERARLVGGALTYGALGVGFGVRATLPTGAGR